MNFIILRMCIQILKNQLYLINQISIIHDPEVFREEKIKLLTATGLYIKRGEEEFTST